MSKLAQLQALAAQAAQTADNMNETTKGGGGAKLLPEGYAFARLVEVVELGNQPQEYNGKAKDPKPEVQLGFALWGQGYQNDDGSPYIVRPYPFTVDRNEKAKAIKVWKALNWRGQATCFAQLLGEAFLIKIVHKKKPDGKVISQVEFEGTLPPLDPVTKQPYGIPEARDEDLMLFLWDYPTIEAWDALYIEGNWDDGQSKNRIQQTLAGACNFAGSPLELLLKTGGKAIPAAPVKPAAPAAGVGTPTPAATAVTLGNTLPQAAIPAVTAALPSIPVPASVGVPASPTIPVTTSPSNPVLPALPTIPGLPTIPQ